MSGLVDSQGQPLSDREAPSADRLRIYGDFSFLALRSTRHSRMSVATLRSYMEPPIVLGQFRVFRFDEVPRAMFTWGWLGPEAERKLITGEALEPTDWTSGDHLWIIDLIAPYRGLTAQIARWIMVRGNFAKREFFFRRVGGMNETRRIVHIDFDADRLSRLYTDAEYLGRLG